MRNAVRAVACLMIGALAALLTMEALLRLLPADRGLQTSASTGPWPLHNFEAHRAYRYSYTWALLNAHTGTTNNYGHIAPRDFQAGSRPLIVVGDSFVESLMNDYDDTLQGILGRQLGASRPVYGLGVSGLSASDYDVMANQAREEFTPAAAVFLIVDGDLSESLQARPGGYVLRPAGSTLAPTYIPLTPDPTMRWVREHVGEPALYGYLRGNLKFSPGDILNAFAKGSHAAQPRPTAVGNPAAPFAVGDWFLDALPRDSGVAPGCVVLLLDADRYAIYDPEQASPAKDPVPLRAYFIDRARTLGYHVVDMAPLFRAEYARTRLKFDYWPIDRHWNRRGHELAAKAVMTELFASDTGTCMPGRVASGS
jgi:hypothetical protein